MRNGFYFKNKHSNDFGVTVQTQSRPIKPEMKIQTYDSPYIDGEYDFSTANAYNREFYKNRVFKMNLQISAADMSELNSKITKITTWLMQQLLKRLTTNPKTTVTKRSFRCRSKCRRGRRWYLIFLTVRYWIAKTSN